MKYLLDTNIVSEMVKPDPDAAVLIKCKQYQNDLAIGAPVWHELQYGCYRLPLSRKRELVEMFLEDVVRKNLPILPYDEQAARWHAMERARLSLEGMTPSFVDGQIAAITITNGLILVTRNQADFKGFSGLKVENWHS
ncbi:MAG: type II toxin-antitoxin system VapC family toxin [Deltaproteobacteria bacterium]|nr:type II toxin-antitoxin system VapC family toxin [Deltaproteobacteria bacterium]